MKALEITQYRVVSAYDKAKGAGKPDPLSSVLKVKGTELLQATSELAVDVAGPMATPIWAQELAAMNEPDDMLEAGSAGDRRLSDAARRLDLRRHQRNPEEHSHQSGTGAVMDFEPSDDQRLLVESVTRMLSDTYGFAQRKGYMALPEGYSPEIWSQFAELGLLGLPFAEEYGGFGGGAQEVMLVMQAFGRVLVLEPFLPTVVLGGTAIERRRQRGAEGRAAAGDRRGQPENGVRPRRAAGALRPDRCRDDREAERFRLGAGRIEDGRFAWRGGGQDHRQRPHRRRPIR